MASFCTADFRMLMQSAIQVPTRGRSIGVHPPYTTLGPTPSIKSPSWGKGIVYRSWVSLRSRVIIIPTSFELREYREPHLSQPRIFDFVSDCPSSAVLEYLKDIPSKVSRFSAVCIH